MPVYRTPSSLNWLIRKYARVQGEIRDLRRTQSEASARLAQLEAETQSLREVLAMHEIRVDPDDIVPVRSTPRKKLLKHGDLTRSIYACLRVAKGDPRSTSEIAQFVLKVNGIELPSQLFVDFSCSVQLRLRRLTMNGKVRRLHNPKENLEGSWRLP